MSTHAPTVSVLICNYNQERYIAQCLAGIRRQTLKDFEVVITDDGSTDKSASIIARVAAEDKRIKPVYFPKNRGVIAAVQETFARVTGRLLFCEGSDDFIANEHFFAEAVAALDKHPNAAGFFGLAGLLYAEKNELAGRLGQSPAEGCISPEECYRQFLRGTMFVPGSSSIWRHECMTEIGGFDYSLGPQIDFLVNHALPARHGVVFNNTAFTCQRIYQNASNFGSKGGTLWEAAGRLEKVEKRMREWAQPYEGMEEDWKIWRARWTLEAIRTTGVRLT